MIKTTLSLGIVSLMGALSAPDSVFDDSPMVPIAGSHAVSPVSGDALVFFGQDATDDADLYSRHVALADLGMSAAPANLSVSGGPGANQCSAGPGNGGASSCSTQNFPRTSCSTSGANKSCSADGPVGGPPSGGRGTFCSTAVPDYRAPCSVLGGGDDSHCSSYGGGPNSDYRCSAYSGLCSVTSGGSDANDPNSCSAFGPFGDKPQCSTFGGGFQNTPPLCSVMKGLSNARCTVVPTDISGPGDGVCSTLDLGGKPVGGDNVLCSTIDFGPPPTVEPPKDGICWGIPPEPDPEPPVPVGGN